MAGTRLGVLVLFHVLLGAAMYVNQSVPDAYMVRRRYTATLQRHHWALLQDEIFHYPQTRQYCAGRWHSWDPKITTFPGLYVVGVAYAKALAAAEQWLGITDTDQA